MKNPIPQRQLEFAKGNPPPERPPKPTFPDDPPVRMPEQPVPYPESNPSEPPNIVDPDPPNTDWSSIDGIRQW